ncbi:MAG TPA: GNAT family N-acetyltransferase [Candidatus Elarobacter sp.]|nr:GNAT family N-acetyltransferase [Candidatus Elarobacter sp.]
MIIESLQKGKHDRVAFRCGTESLDRFLHEHAHQAASKRLSQTYVAVDKADECTILGYYSLTTFRVEPNALPEVVIKRLRLPRHELPAALIARLAVKTEARGRGFGTNMVVDALARCERVSSEIGGVAIIVDAIDRRAVAFYERLGFKRFPTSLAQMFMPMADVHVTVRAIEDGRRRGSHENERISFAPPPEYTRTEAA